jgi:hypothetical protein
MTGSGALLAVKVAGDSMAGDGQDVSVGIAPWRHREPAFHRLYCRKRLAVLDSSLSECALE